MGARYLKGGGVGTMRGNLLRKNIRKSVQDTYSIDNTILRVTRSTIGKARYRKNSNNRTPKNGLKRQIPTLLVIVNNMNLIKKDWKKQMLFLHYLLKQESHTMIKQVFQALNEDSKKDFFCQYYKQRQNRFINGFKQ